MSKPKEIKVTLFSTGKAFDPRNQKRTSAMKDIMAKDNAKDKAKLDKMFGIGGNEMKRRGVDDLVHKSIHLFAKIYGALDHLVSDKPRAFNRLVAKKDRLKQDIKDMEARFVHYLDKLGERQP